MKSTFIAIFLFLQCSFVAIHSSPSIVPRVSRGTTARATDWPSQVVIVNKESNILCGGSLISDNWVLTVGHCASNKRPEVGDPLKHILIMGAQDRYIAEKNQVIRGVKRVVVHPRYETQNHSFDMALLQLNESINFNKYTQLKPICLDVCGLNMTTTKCITTGFGAINNQGDNPRELQQLEMKLFDQKKCEDIHSKFFSGWSKERVTDRQFCMVSKNAPKPGDNSNGGVCGGDSGGPVQCQVGSTYFQTGVTWSGTDCERQPSVYQLIPKYFREFIEKETRYKLPKHCPRNPAC